MGDETITESEIWADLDAQFLLETRQPGDIDIRQFAEHYGINEVNASRRMHKLAKSGEYEMLTVRDDTSATGMRKVLRKVRDGV